MELHELATEAYAWFAFDTLKDGAPEWIRDLVYDTHGDFLPDDWRYACIRAAVEWIADESDPDESGEFADSQADVYTGAALQWLASNLQRVGYCDEAANEYGIATDQGGDFSITRLIRWGQYAEAREVFSSVVSALEAELESRNEVLNPKDALADARATPFRA